MCFPGYHLLYWAEDQRHPSEGLLITVSNKAQKTLEEKTSKYSVLNSNKARVHERCNFSYLFNIMQKQDLSATVSESSLSCLLSKPQRAGKPQESAATSSQPAELLLSPGIRHCAVFTRRLKHLEKHPCCARFLQRRLAWRNLRSLHACPPSSPAVGLFAVTWRCQHCLHTFPYPAPPSELSSQALLTNYTNEGYQNKPAGFVQKQ